MRIILISDYKSLNSIEAEANLPDSVIVCLDVETKQALEARGKKAILYDCNIGHELGISGDLFAFSLSRKWHFFQNEDFTKYSGISLGLAHEWVFWFEHAIPKVKFLVGLKSIIKDLQPAEILADRALGEWRSKLVERIAAKEANRTALAWFGLGAEGKETVFDGSVSGWKLNRSEKTKKIIVGAYSRIYSMLQKNQNRPKVLSGSYFSLVNIYAQWAKKKEFEMIFLSPSKPFLLNPQIMGALPGLLDLRKCDSASKSQLDKISEKYANIRQNPDYQKLFCFEGIEMADLFGKDVEKSISGQFPLYASYCDEYANALKSEKIDAILLPFDTPPRESILLQTAKIMKIPTIVIIHGIMYGQWFNDSYYSHADNLFVWGDWQAEVYRELAKKNSYSITITGNPKFDTIYRAAHAQKAKNRRARFTILLLSDPKNTGLVYASSEDPENCLHGLMNELKGMDVDVMVKPHPGSNAKYYLGQIAKYPNAQLVAGRDIADCIAEADVVISSFSTTLMESLLMQKPTIFYNLSRFVHDCEAIRRLSKDGLKEYADPKEARAAIENIMLGSLGCLEGHLIAPEKLEYYCGRLDGQASRHVVDEVNKLAKMHLEKKQ